MNSAARKMDRKTAGNFWGSDFMSIKQYKQHTKEMRDSSNAGHDCIWKRGQNIIT